MISADTGATLNVIGSSIAIVASGPMPGSTPISVPRKHPTKQYHRFCSVSATLKPRIRLLNSSMSHPHDQWIRETEAPDEERPRPDREPDRHQQNFDEFVLGSPAGGHECRHD